MRQFGLHLYQSDCASEIQPRRGKLHFTSKEPITTCMTLQQCLLLPVRLFFQFVFKVQYIFTHQKKIWSRFRLQLLLSCLMTLAYINQ